MKILHLSFHIGTANAVESMLSTIQGIDLTTEIVTSGRGGYYYNMTFERANELWDNNKVYYNSFDVIITTDTALLSRPFLQNYYKGKLIILISNRFDYWDTKGEPDKIDQYYYTLFNPLNTETEFVLLGNTEFEKIYALYKNVFVGDIVKLVRKPIVNIYKSHTHYVPTYHNDGLMSEYCNKNKMNIQTGRYFDMEHLSTFKSIIHFPYTWASIFLFDALSVGVPFYVPSKKLLLELLKTVKGYWFQNSNYCEKYIDVCEFYREENNKFIKYFDSFDDINDIEINHEEIYEEAEKLFNLNQNKWKQILNL